MIVFDERLKECPLCGGKCYIEEEMISGVLMVIKIRCKDCGLAGYKNFLPKTKNAVEKTIEYWNNRQQISN